MTRDDSNDGWEDSDEGDLSRGAQEAEFEPEIDFESAPRPICLEPWSCIEPYWIQAGGLHWLPKGCVKLVRRGGHDR